MGDTSRQKENFQPAMVWHMQSPGYLGKSHPTFGMTNTSTGADKQFSYTNNEDICQGTSAAEIHPRCRPVLNGLSRGFKPYRYTAKGTSHPSEPNDKVVGGTIDNDVKASKELKRMWENFGNDTTIHGVKQIGNKTRGKISRFVWLTLVCISAAVLSYTLGNLLIEYNQYKTVTKVETKILTSWPFPSVTVCNLCPINKSTDKSTVTKYLEPILASSSVLQLNLSRMGINMSDPNVQKVLRMTLSDLYEMYSYNLDDFILFATFNGERLNISERFEITETSHGRCFTFNGPKYIEGHNVTVTTQDGRHSGLHVYAYINQDNYFLYGDITAGIRVYISHHPETPRIRNDGVDIHPGTSTLVALNPVTYTFLPKPYKSYGDQYCEEIPEEDVHKKMVNATFYSYERCIEQCVVFNATINCSCAMVGLYVPGYRPCTFLQYSNCVTPFINHFRQSSTDNCDCPRPCTFTKYAVSMSASQMPSKVAAKDLARMFHKNASTDHFRDNFLDVRIFMESMLTKTIRHEPQYTIGSIVAFLGGQMGFFLGASLITMAELIETLVVSGYVLFLNKILKLGQVRPATRVTNVQARDK